MTVSRTLILACTLVLVFLVLFPVTVHAYVGPGAGFAFIGSFLALFSALLAGMASLLIWPVRYVYRAFRRRKMLSHSNIKRMIVVSLNGLDRVLVEKWMAAGQLPNIKKLAEEGSYSPLKIASPADSHGTLRSFITGVDSSGPEMTDQATSSALKFVPPARTFQVGNWILPLGRPSVEITRKHPDFWKVLGDYGIPSHILHMPLSFPPEKIAGNLLLASGVYDLRGTSGSYTYYTTNAEELASAGRRSELISGEYHLVAVEDGMVNATLSGPANPVRRNHPNIEIPFSVEIDAQACEALLKICGCRYQLKEREFTPWIRLDFKAAPGKKIRGIVRFYITNIAPDFGLYVTPINIDPEKPMLPISSPSYYSRYLSKMFGEFSTLDMQADVQALTEGIVDEGAFLTQAHDHHDAQEKMFFNALEKSRRGLVACVISSMESIQRAMQGIHHDRYPAEEGKDLEAFVNTAHDLYRRIDGMVGRVMDLLGPDDHLMIVSIPDHHPSHEDIIDPARDSVNSYNDQVWNVNHGNDSRHGSGLLLSTHRILSGEPDIVDLAPTIITAFGVVVPDYMTGQILEVEHQDKLQAKQATA